MSEGHPRLVEFTPADYHQLYVQNLQNLHTRFTGRSIESTDHETIGASLSRLTLPQLSNKSLVGMAGPHNVGLTTVRHELEGHGAQFIRKYTSRETANFADEVFQDRANLERMLQEKTIIGKKHHDSHVSGIPAAAINYHLKNPSPTGVFFNCGIKTYTNVIDRFPEDKTKFGLVYVLPPSIEELIRRATQKGESEVMRSLSSLHELEKLINVPEPVAFLVLNQPEDITEVLKILKISPRQEVKHNSKWEDQAN